MDEIKKDIAFLKKKQGQLADEVKQAVANAMAKVLSDMKHDIVPHLKQETMSAVFEMKNELLAEVGKFALDTKREVQRGETVLKAEVAACALVWERGVQHLVRKDIQQCLDEIESIRQIILPFKAIREMLTKGMVVGPITRDEEK